MEGLFPARYLRSVLLVSILARNHDSVMLLACQTRLLTDSFMTEANKTI
jgi:hypothetical protein